MIKIAIIEDDAGIRTKFERYLENQSDLKCILVCESVESFFNSLQPANAPQVVLSDIGLPGVSGIVGISRIKERLPDCQILMITIYKDSDKIFNALCAGADGYLLKNTPLQDVAESIRKVARGDAAMSPSIARKVIDYFRPQRKPIELLTEREREIVEGITEGLSYKLVGAKLGISFETVKHHIKNIYRKLKINSKAELISKSYKGEL